MIVNPHKILAFATTKKGVFLIFLIGFIVIAWASGKIQELKIAQREEMMAEATSEAEAQADSEREANQENPSGKEQPAEEKAEEESAVVEVSRDRPTRFAYEEVTSNEPALIEIKRSRSEARKAAPTQWQGDRAVRVDRGNSNAGPDMVEVVRDYEKRRGAAAEGGGDNASSGSGFGAAGNDLSFNERLLRQQEDSGSGRNKQAKRLTLGLISLSPEQTSRPTMEMPKESSTGRGRGSEREAEPSGKGLPENADFTEHKRTSPADDSAFAPFGRMLKCELVNSIDSTSVETPIIGLVTEDLYWNGKLIVPANSEVHGMAKVDRFRERISTDTRWNLVMYSGDDKEDGRTVQITGMGLDRDDKRFSDGVKSWGISDASYGIRGYVIRDNRWDEIVMFASNALGSIAQGLRKTEVQTGAFGASTVPKDTAENAVLGGASDVLLQYAARVQEKVMSEGIFVRVPAGKQFYVYVTQELAPYEYDGGAGSVPVGKDIIDAKEDTERMRDPDSTANMNPEDRMVQQYLEQLENF
jgi:hypothetical protein